MFLKECVKHWIVLTFVSFLRAFQARVASILRRNRLVLQVPHYTRTVTAFTIAKYKHRWQMFVLTECWKVFSHNSTLIITDCQWWLSSNRSRRLQWWEKCPWGEVREIWPFAAPGNKERSGKTFWRAWDFAETSVFVYLQARFLWTPMCDFQYGQHWGCRRLYTIRLSEVLGLGKEADPPSH